MEQWPRRVVLGPRPAIGGVFCIVFLNWTAAREAPRIGASTTRKKSMQITYDRKPSKPQLVAAIRKALNAGHGIVSLVWGENAITIERGPWGLDGRGWIGRNGGQDLAAEFKMTS